MEIRNRLAHDWPSLIKTCELAGTTACAKQKTLVAGLLPFSMESLFTSTFEKVKIGRV